MDGFCTLCPWCSPLLTREVQALPRVCSEDLLSCGRSSTIMHVEGRTAASPAPCKGRGTLLVSIQGTVSPVQAKCCLTGTCCCEALRAQCAALWMLGWGTNCINTCGWGKHVWGKENLYSSLNCPLPEIMEVDQKMTDKASSYSRIVQHYSIRELVSFFVTHLTLFHAVWHLK